jgi:two-component system cell cycle sensor histidine kinase/response regulator CckA
MVRCRSVSGKVACAPVQDRESLEREVELLRARVADLQRRLAQFSPDEGGRTLLSLEEREELLVEAERIAHLGTWAWNPESDEVFWSEELFRILGYDASTDRASTAGFFAAVHPEDRERVQATSAQGLQTGEAHQVDYRVLRRDGSVRHVTMNGAFLFDRGGRLRRVVGAVLDLTELRRLQEKLLQAEKMDAIGRLAAGVAHDFNNVLLVVRGNLELSRLPDSRETRQVFDALESARELTDKLLTLGRRSALRRRVVDLNELVGRTVALVERMVREQFRLRVSVSPGPLLVDIDETLIEQAIVNLLLNARDVLSGGGQVDVLVRALELDRTRVAEITVHDDGPGMDETTRARIFDPFFTTKVPTRGHGLGLAMVQGSVAQHGGTVTVESAPGAGTTFRLRFPRLEGGEAAPIRRPSSLPPPGPRARYRVLVIEDQDVVGGTVTRLLERLEHQVELVPTADAALSALAARRFDVVLCDVMMPDMRGPALIARARQRCPGACRRVVFMTGNSGDQVELGPDVGLLTKPFTLEQLDDAIARAGRAD